jgi:hypothetical protein
MGKLTKIERAVMATKILYLLEGRMLYSEEDVAGIKSRIKELEAEVTLLREGQPDIPEHENIRGKEYYK